MKQTSLELSDDFSKSLSLWGTAPNMEQKSVLFADAAPHLSHNTPINSKN